MHPIGISIVASIVVMARAIAGSLANIAKRLNKSLGLVLWGTSVWLGGDSGGEGGGSSWEWL